MPISLPNSSKMKINKFVIIVIVVAALLGYVASSAYLFYLALKCGDSGNEALGHVTGTLTALVGGIVATSFGVKPDDAKVQSTELFKIKTAYLGGNTIKSGNEKLKQVMGTLYSLSYVIIGFFAIGIWIFTQKDDTMVYEQVSNAARTFLGLLVAIVIGYFSKPEQ